MRFLILILTMLFTTGAFAYVVPTKRDIKPASQAMLEHQTVTDAEIADDDQVKTTYAGPTAATALVLTSFTAQPDVARNITITPTGTTGDLEACIITVAGTNILGRAISETITFEADASTKIAGAKAFKTVTSVTWPADCESGGFAVTWVIGTGDVLGMKRCMDYAGAVAWTVFDGVYEGTRATCIADVDEVEKNTCDINGTLNAAKEVDFFFVQNFRCLP